MTPLLYNPPTDEAMWLTWSAIHQQEHLQIVFNIFEKRQLLVPMLPLDPVPLNNPQAMLTWFMNHQSVHNAMNAAMGTPGNDLSYVDFRDRSRMIFWIEINALEHAEIAAAIQAFQPPQPQQQLPTSQQQLFQQQVFAPQGQQAFPAPQPVMPQPLTIIQPQGGLLGGPQAQPIISVQPQPNPPIQPQPNPPIQPQPGPSPAPPLVAGTPAFGVTGDTPMLPGTPGGGGAAPAPATTGTTG